MAKKTLPSPEVLRQLLRYEPETGKLFHTTRTPDFFPDTPRRANAMSIWNTRFGGKEAFTCTDAHGYKIGNMLGVGLKAHRVIWAMVHGEWPEHDIDHINGVRDDNRLKNLRHATRAQNLANSRKLPTPHGYRGIRPHGQKWLAIISVNNRPRHVGVFATKEEAARAWDAAARHYRGEFAATNFPTARP